MLLGAESQQAGLALCWEARPGSELGELGLSRVPDMVVSPLCYLNARNKPVRWALFSPEQEAGCPAAAAPVDACWGQLHAQLTVPPPGAVLAVVAPSLPVLFLSSVKWARQ